MNNAIFDPKGRFAKRKADNNLKYWARGYLYADSSTIMYLAGGNPSCTLSTPSSASQEVVDDDRYRALNEIVIQMPQIHKYIIFKHYRDRRDLSVKDFLKTPLMTRQHGVLPRPTYDRWLSKAKLEFILSGGLTV